VTVFIQSKGLQVPESVPEPEGIADVARNCQSLMGILDCTIKMGSFY